MQENTELWQELCRQAAAEQDSNKLMQLTKRIIELLDKKQTRLDKLSDADDYAKNA